MREQNGAPLNKVDLLYDSLGQTDGLCFFIL